MSIPLLLTLVAAYQFYLSQNTTLTQWKGGGFGMYTTVHPTYNKVTFNDSLVNLDFKANASEEEFSDSYYKFLLYPNNTTLENLVQKTRYENSDSLEVKIYDLEFDLLNNTATYAKVIFEHTYKKD
jgi:hypothetical protein